MTYEEFLKTKEIRAEACGMVSDLRGYGADNQIYHEAVAIACAELMKLETDGKT